MPPASRSPLPPGDQARGEWKIQRYATAGSIPGGFTRLLHHAQQHLLAESHDLRRWISCSARDVSDGGMYKTAGFTAEQHLAPDYSYVGRFTGESRRPKEAFQRRTFRDTAELLWDEDWTEAEAARRNGLRRVWDSGKTRWVRDVTPRSD